MTDWMEKKHIECWKSSKDCKHSKALMEGLQQGRATKLQNMSRRQLSVVIGLLPGHLGLDAEGVSTAMKLLNFCYVNANP